MILTMNTNGTLIDEEMADFLAENKPRRINITLYGVSNDTYKRLCHNPKGLDQTVRGIKLLKERNIDVKMNVTVVKENLDDLQRALQALKDIRTKNVDDLTLPLRNALKAITTNEISVELADKFYEASVNNKGELTPYKDYTQVRTVLNGLK